MIKRGGDHPYPRLIASKPKYHALHMVLLNSIDSQVHPFPKVSVSGGYQRRRRGIYKMSNLLFSGKGLNSTNFKKYGDDFFTQLPLSNKTRDIIKFTESSKGCVYLSNDSYEVDIKLLLEVAGVHGHSYHGICLEG